MAVFAKGMTNGYPVTAVIGKQNIMEASQETFISSTFWTERVGFAGAVASIKCYEKYHVAEHQLHVGERVEKGWKELAEKHHLSIETNGILPLKHFAFEYENPLAYKTFFTQEMLKLGFLAGPGVYASLAHTDELVDKYLEACDSVFGEIEHARAEGKDIETLLEGPVCHAGFERLN
jgi:glutamate-1-semialdehyde aminotransferase